MSAAQKKPVVGVRQSDGLVRDIRTGKTSAMAEGDRLAVTLGSIKSASTPPWQCGDALPVSPARGPVQRFTPEELVPDGQGGVKPELTGYVGRTGARVRDVFDIMVDQARTSHAKEVRLVGDKAGPFVPPFTWGQVQTARDYAALSERCHASGLKCASLESLGGGGGSGGGREEAVFDDLARLRALHRRIGTGLAKQLRRHRPSGSSSGPDPRRAITARRLIDQVCLCGLTPKEILRADGWTGDGKQIKDLRAALISVLDRMQGYDGDKPQNMG